MEHKKNGITLIVVAIVVCAIGISYFFGFDINKKLNPEKTADSLEELATLVYEQINTGKKQGDFYVSDIPIDDIDSINEYLCTMNGSVSKYSIIEKGYKGMKIRFIYDISDNYYVYRKYKFNESIPADRAAALKLYDEVSSFMSEYIKEGMSDYDKELAIHDYIVKNCKYGYVDYSKEYAYRAYGALVQKKAVCNGYAEAMALLLTCCDIENDIMTGTAKDELHAWNRVKIDGHWYQVDATWDDPIPDRGSFVGHMYFNVTDDVMDDTHDWNRDGYEACTVWDYNFFQYNNLIGNHANFEAEIKALAYTDINGEIEYIVTDYNGDNYDFSFLENVNNINSVAYSKDSYGNYEIITMQLNAR